MIIHKGYKSVDSATINLSKAEIGELQKNNFTACISFHNIWTSWNDLHYKGIKDIFDNLGIEVKSVKTACFDLEKQFRQLESFIDLKPDIIISIPVNETETAGIYKEIAGNNIKIIFLDACPDKLKYKVDYDSFVMFDAERVGAQSAEMLANALCGEGKVGILYFIPPYYCNKVRTESAIRLINDKYPDIEIIARKGFSSIEECYDEARALIIESNNIQGIWTPWDVPAMAAISALRDMKIKNVFVSTNDLDIDIAIEIAKKELAVGTSAQDSYKKGQTLAKAAAMALLEKEVPPFIITPCEYVTRDNLLDSWEKLFSESPPPSLMKIL